LASSLFAKWVEHKVGYGYAHPTHTGAQRYRLGCVPLASLMKRILDHKTCSEKIQKNFTPDNKAAKPSGTGFAEATVHWCFSKLSPKDATITGALTAIVSRSEKPKQ
jgi:hypothetical protein